MIEWIPVVQKTTNEHSTKAFKDGPQPEDTETTRVWYVNKDVLQALGIDRVMGLIKEMPEL
jgi:hypothetical protein